MHERDDYPATLTLEWLTTHDLPVYVRNITRPRGQIAVNFPQVNGGVKVLKLPRIYLPICLSDQLAAKTILQSDDLRSCIVKGVVDLVRPDLAAKELEGEDASQAITEHTLSEFSAKQAFVSKRVRDMENSQGKDPKAMPTLQALGVETNIITPKILALVEKLQHGDVSIKAALTELRTIEEELRETDCSYIISNGPEGQIRTFAQKVLARIRNAGASEYNVVDDDEATLTNEQQAREAQREAAARGHQQV